MPYKDKEQYNEFMRQYRRDNSEKTKYVKERSTSVSFIKKLASL